MPCHDAGQVSCPTVLMGCPMSKTGTWLYSCKDFKIQEILGHALPTIFLPFATWVEHCQEPIEFLLPRQPSMEGDSKLTFLQASPLPGTILVWGEEEKSQSLIYFYKFPSNNFSLNFVSLWNKLEADGDGWTYSYF